MKKTIYLYLLLLIVACTPNTATKTFKHIKNYTFYSGFSSGNKQIKIINGKEYICYGDFKTRKKIAIHSLDNLETYFIDVSKITTSGQKIDGYEIINFDTIYVLTKYNNQVFLIDSTGSINKVFDFNKPPLTPHFELGYASKTTPFLINDNAFLFSLEYRPNNEYHFDSLSGYISYYKDYRTSAQICKIYNINADSLAYQFGGENIYYEFTNDSDLTLEPSDYYILKDKIIFRSFYSDSLYLIDLGTLQLMGKIKLISKYSQLFISPTTIESLFKGTNLLISNYKTNGQIRNIVYDEKQHLYYCAVSHKPKNNKLPWDGPFAWSIIILDDNFKQIDEVKMDEKKYWYSSMVMCSKGLLISNRYEASEDEDYFIKNTLALFRYE